MRLAGQVLTPGGFVGGALSFGEVIEGVEPGSAPDRFILPGFIDVHVHGGGGGDSMDGPGGVNTLARFHARHGTTSLLPTTITAPWPDVLAALHGVAEVRSRGVRDGADVLGAHLEGPFISPHKLGAQPPHALIPTDERVAGVLALDVVRVVTLAPEIECAPEAARQFARACVRVSLGHTAATYQGARAAMEVVRAAGGIHGATHLYNAMGGLSGREPGMVGAVLSDPHGYAELILDLHHVHPGSFLSAHAALGERLLLITDAMRAAGLGDGESELGGQKVSVQNGRATLENGGLAGSVLTLDAALRNAVGCGLPLEGAARMLGEVPARYLGLRDRGRLGVGLRADLVVLDPDLTVSEVWVKGERIA